MHDVQGAEVRLRYSVPSDQRDAARAAAERYRDDLLDRGALSVKLEEVVESSTRARTPEVAKAKRLDEKLEAFWTSKGFVPGERREPILAKLSLIEQEHHHHAS